MNINPRSIQRHNGIGFWRNPDGTRSAEWFGKTFTFKKTAKGWEGYGKVFKTLADAADYLSN